jgi:hypothetical protein
MTSETTSDGMESHLIAEDAAVHALRLIARGRRDNGRPISAETARTVARETLTALQEAW